MVDSFNSILHFANRHNIPSKPATKIGEFQDDYGVISCQTYHTSTGGLEASHELLDARPFFAPDGLLAA